MLPVNTEQPNDSHFYEFNTDGFYHILQQRLENNAKLLKVIVKNANSNLNEKQKQYQFLFAPKIKEENMKSKSIKESSSIMNQSINQLLNISDQLSMHLPMNFNQNENCLNINPNLNSIANESVSKAKESIIELEINHSDIEINTDENVGIGKTDNIVNEIFNKLSKHMTIHTLQNNQ